MTAQHANQMMIVEMMQNASVAAVVIHAAGILNVVVVQFVNANHIPVYQTVITENAVQIHKDVAHHAVHVMVSHIRQGATMARANFSQRV